MASSRVTVVATTFGKNPSTLRKLSEDTETWMIPPPYLLS